MDLLRSSADNHFLESVLDQQGTETDGVRTARAGSRHCQVHSLQSEYAVEIHRHGRVHRLEDSSGAAHHRVLLLADNVHGFDHGKSGGIVAVKKADLI